MNKITTLEDAVKEFVHARSHIAFGGFPLSRKPTVFCKEIIRQNKGKRMLDLTISGPGIGDTGNGLMVAAGLVDAGITSYVSMEGAGPNPNIRRSLYDGIPRRIKIEDNSNLAMAMKYLAGGLHVPFIPSHSGKCTDLRKHGFGNVDEELGLERDEDTVALFRYEKMPVIDDPFGSRQKVALLQALTPDLAVIHVPFADRKGNSIILGSLYYDSWLPHAARNIIVVTDHVIDTECCKQYPNLVVVPGVAVDAVVPWYMAAWPHNCPGIYGEDLTHITEYVQVCGTQEGTQKYMEDYVFSWSSHEEYMELIGKDRVKELEDNPSTRLAEPFKKWIIPLDMFEHFFNKTIRGVKSRHETITTKDAGESFS